MLEQHQVCSEILWDKYTNQLKIFVLMYPNLEY